MRKLKNRREKRIMRHLRVRRKIKGNSNMPRLSVFRSTKQLYAQLIDDTTGKTIFGASTVTPKFIKSIKGDKPNKVELSKLFGKFFAEGALEMMQKKVYFDRGGHKYHGRVKAFAEGARENGLEF